MVGCVGEGGGGGGVLQAPQDPLAMPLSLVPENEQIYILGVDSHIRRAEIIGNFEKNF